MNPVKTKSLTKIAFKTLGCKLNFTETEEIANKFKSDIYVRVDPNDVADIYVFNTCSVTENADKKFKNLVALDNSQEMLEKCKNTISSGNCEGVEFLLGDTSIALSKNIKSDLLILNMVLI